jgi:isoquinoline 1-oxidoreductase subunit beta
MLRRAAAATWKVPLAECAARDGAIVHGPSGRSARYGELVAAAAAQDVPDVALKPPEQWRWIGKSVPRLDARMKVDGSGVYGMDVQMPGLLTCVVARPPVRGGRVRRFDERIRSRPGVVDAFAFEGGVAVVARSFWEARTAADAAAVDWELGPLAQVSSAQLFADYAVLAARKGRKARCDGDAYAGLRRAARVLEATYQVPYLAHVPMEPLNATAHVAGGRCEIWAPTQSPGLARALAADALGYDQRDVSVHTTLLGGGFGRRIPNDEVVEAVRIALRVGKPVKVIWTREDDLANDYYRPMALSLLRGGLDGKGTITAWLHRLVTQSIVAQGGGEFLTALAPNGTPRSIRRWTGASGPRALARGVIVDTTSVEGAADLPYAIPDLRVEYAVAETGVPVGFWRSVGNSHNAFVTEGFLDELIHAGGGDPFAARRALLRDQPRHRRVLETVAAKAGWGQPLPPGVGRGIAVHFSFHSYCAQVVEASVYDGAVRVHRVVAAIDCGRVVNPDLVRAQVESAVIFGLSAALDQQITFAAGRVEQTNFHQFRLLRMHQCPVIEVHLVDGGDEPTGVGEPGLPPVAPALCGAIFAATGKRIRRLPISAELA